MEQKIIAQVYKHSIDKVLEVYRQLKQEQLKKTNKPITRNIDDFLQLNAILNIIEQDSEEQFEHFIKVTNLASKFGNHFGLTKQEIQELIFLAKFHDIGKINVPAEILNKPSKLNEEEWMEIKKHPIHSQKILNACNILKTVARYAEAHHEKYDGTGYPYGLKGNNIPLLARIISIFDAYDVITSGRVYQAGVSHEEAIKELKRCAGTQFDPELVEVFAKITTPKQEKEDLEK